MPVCNSHRRVPLIHMKFKVAISSRSSHILKNAAASGVTKGVGVAINLAMVPLTIGYLGPEKYGLWMAISSLIAILQMMDLGIGNAIISLIADEKNKDGEQSTRQILVSALIVLTCISITGITIAVLVTPHINWQWLLNYSTKNLNEIATTSIQTFLVVFALNITVSIAQSARLGLQEGHKNGIFNIAGQLTNLTATYFTIQANGDLPLLIAAASSGTLLFHSINLLFLFRRLPKTALTKKTISRYVRPVLSKGFGFFSLQIIGIISYNLDNMIVAHYVGLKAVPQYSIAMRIFTIPGAILALFFSGLWAAYADAKSKDDWSWIRWTFKKTITTSALASLLISSILAATLPFSMHLLSKGTVKPTVAITLGMFLWGALSAVGGATASLLNGLHILKVQTYTAIIAAFLNITFSITLAIKIGASGPIWGSVLAQISTYPILIWYSFKIASNK